MHGQCFSMTSAFACLRLCQRFLTSQTPHEGARKQSKFFKRKWKLTKERQREMTTIQKKNNNYSFQVKLLLTIPIKLTNQATRQAPKEALEDVFFSGSGNILLRRGAVYSSCMSSLYSSDSSVLKSSNVYLPVKSLFVPEQPYINVKSRGHTWYPSHAHMEL